MKLHWHDLWHHSEPESTDSDAYTNLKYGAVLLIGIPTVVIGVQYVIESIFSLVWH